MRQAANLAVDMDSIIKHVLNGLGDRTATTVNPMAFGFDPSVKPYKQDLAQAKKLLADAGFPNGLEVGFLRTQPVVEPGLIQTSDAIVADLAKAGIRAKQRMVGEIGPFTNLIRDNKADPMFEWSWGYYSIFDADAILFDVMTCNQPYSYYCNKALDDLVIQGRSTLDSQEADGDLRQGPEAHLRRRRLHLQVGPARRLGRQQPDRLRGAARRDRPDVRRDAAEEVGAHPETGRSAAVIAPAPGEGRPPAAMRRYLARQLVQLVVVILGISVLAFGILHVLGDPVLLLLPQNAGKEEFERYRHLLGLDRPLYVQYWKFVSRRGAGRLRQVVVRRHAGLQARARADAADDLPDLCRPRRRAADRAAAGHPRRAQAPLVGGQPLHGGGGGRPGHADLLARHHADHRLRGAAARSCPPPGTAPGRTS